MYIVYISFKLSVTGVYYRYSNHNHISQRLKNNGVDIFKSPERKCSKYFICIQSSNDFKDYQHVVPAALPVGNRNCTIYLIPP